VSSLTARLYALIAALLGAGLLLAGLVLDRDSSRIGLQLLEAEGERELSLLAISAPTPEIARGDIATVDAWCDRTGKALDRRVTVIDARGRVLGDSRVPADSIALLQNHADRPEVRAALSGGIGEATRRSWTIREELFYIAEPLERLTTGDSTRPPSAVLRLSMPISKAYEFGRRWQRHLWIAVSTVFLVVLAGGYLLGRRIDRRLRLLRQSAEMLGSGDLGVRIPIDTHDELGALARVLRSMAEHLRTKLMELQAERDMREAVLAHLPLGIALLSPGLTIEHANDRFWSIVGVERGLGPAPSLAMTRQAALEEVAEDAIRRGASVRREVALYIEERRDYEVSVVPVSRGEAPGAWLLTIEDLKPERTMANLRREFVANASHELKTPLTSIRGYAETLLQGGLDDEANRARFVETIHAQAVRLEALVEDLLELADLERPDAVLDLKDWDMATVAREMVAGLEDLAKRRGLTLRLEARPGVHVRMDRKRVELALRNLLDNAIKYTDAGSVLVSVETTPAGTRVSVADTGRGIESEHLPRLFERFYRVDRGRSRALGGTGLGLSIVKHVVELHGGRVGVESAPGRGSTFWFEIPRDGSSGHS